MTPFEVTVAVWDKMMRGLSTRNYGAVVKDFHEAYGVEKSAVSDNFIASSREKLQALMERPLGDLRLCAVLIDGTPFRDRQMIVALGINIDGRKTVLGLREGATENAAVVSELLGDLASRGLDFSVPRLYVLDGGKALAAAVRRHAGEAAMIQRCQVHKRRNVIDHLPKEHKSAVAFRHLECRRAHAIGKQSFSTAQYDRKYLQPEGIDQIMLEERLNQICASPNVQIRPFLLLDFGDCFRNISV